MAHPRTQTELATLFSDFLTVSIHQILYLRAVYPRETFLAVRAYNHPVRQSRHPKVCEYIRDVSKAVRAQILNGGGAVAAVSVVLFSLRDNVPLERYTFDLSAFPRVPLADLDVAFSRGETEENHDEREALHVGMQFRACLARLDTACARLSPLSPLQPLQPAGDNNNNSSSSSGGGGGGGDELSFTVCIEVRHDALPPAGCSVDEQAWIVAESRGSLDEEGEGRAPPPTSRTVPVRRVEAGELRLELWIEQAR